ncbi:MAG: FAD-binding oxidoreductase [Pirellula sp.]|nr:FAD-binding oxidoreductase [Pirellula sp.]
MESVGLIILTVSCLALAFLATLAASATLAARKQSYQLEQANAAAFNLKLRLLSSTLERTHADLSVRKRPPKWYEVLIARVDQESDDVKSFYLVRNDGESLPAALAGQHLLIEMPAAANRSKQCRCYTLSDHCDDGYWRISVKRNSDSPESVSRWLHDVLAKGDSVRVKGPSGSFFLQTTTNRHVVLLSAGIGITPMLPMLQETLRRPHASLTFFAQFRDVDHMPFAESLLNIAHQFPMVRMRLFLSQFPRGVTGGKDAVIQQGKFTASDVVETLEDLAHADCYLCGPEAWQSNMLAALTEAGVLESQIHFELFKESEKPISINLAVKQQPCSVHFRQSNKLEAFAATYPNLLGFAIKSDIPIDSGCRTGACGSCLVKLIEGKVKYTRRPQFPLKQNEILPCVCVPDGDIVVDV